MKTNYWNIYKNEICYWSFSLGKLNEAEYLKLILDVVLYGYDSQLLIPHEGNHELKIDNILKKINSSQKKRLKLGMALFLM